jgi:RNA polymerase sigma factor (sigma-70 family)
MSAAPLDTVIQHLRQIVAAQTSRDSTDAQLVHAFAVERDQSAFTALVQRHGALVMSVCRHVLRHEQDAEDAFQATFLVLARQATTIRKPDSVASWLHGVALRVSWNAKKAAARRRKHEGRAQTVAPPQPSQDLAWPEVKALLDEEIQRLPPKYRTVFVLCCMESHSRAEVARCLGVNEGTISSRLAQARSRLQSRLAQRGVALSVVLGATALADQTARAAVAPVLVDATVKAACYFAAGHPAAAGLVSAEVTALVKGATSIWATLQGKTLTLIVLVTGILTVGAGSVLHWSQAYSAADAGPPVFTPSPSSPALAQLRRTNAKRDLDLTRIDRTILREPVYQSPPKYALLVFGPQAATRVWVVMDGGILYVDRKGTGDLTDPDHRLASAAMAQALEFPRATPSQSPDGQDQVHKFSVGDIQDPSHQVIYQDLTVTSCQFSNGEGLATMSVCVAGRYTQYSSSGLMPLGSRPEEAPVIHFNGPLTLKLVKALEMIPGQKTLTLQAALGTPGLGEKAFAPLGLEDLPAEVAVTAVVKFPGVKADGTPNQTTVCLTRSSRTTGPNVFTGSVLVPADMREGMVGITLSLSNWKGGRVLPDQGAEVPIATGR